jgi:hypothetical protein
VGIDRQSLVRKEVRIAASARRRGKARFGQRASRSNPRRLSVRPSKHGGQRPVYAALVAPSRTKIAKAER